MKPHESPRIRKKSIRGDSGDSWPVWNRGITAIVPDHTLIFKQVKTETTCKAFISVKTVSYADVYVFFRQIKERK